MNFDNFIAGWLGLSLFIVPFSALLGMSLGFLFLGFVAGLGLSILFALLAFCVSGTIAYVAEKGKS